MSDFDIRMNYSGIRKSVTSGFHILFNQLLLEDLQKQNKFLILIKIISEPCYNKTLF